MARPERRYYFMLAERLNRNVRELLATTDARELAEWQAFDRTQNEEWLNKHKQNNATQNDLANSIMGYFGGK